MLVERISVEVPLLVPGTCEAKNDFFSNVFLAFPLTSKDAYQNICRGYRQPTQMNSALVAKPHMNKTFP